MAEPLCVVWLNSIRPAKPRDDGKSIRVLMLRRKIVGLDAVRGFAAFVVFAGHFFDGLGPAVTQRAAGTPLAGFFNGAAAVVLFFVLSGFVLTIRPIANRRMAGLLPLIVKRWPRLAGTVVFAGLLYIAVASIGGFPPLSVLRHLQIQWPPYTYWGQALQDTKVGPVLAEASAGTFFAGSARYNPVLWTMHWEFLGSFLAAALAFIVLLQIPPIVRACLFVLIGLLAAEYSPWLLPFPLGVAGAVIHLKLGHRIRLPTPFAVAMTIVAILIWSWDLRVNSGLWSWTHEIPSRYRLLLWTGAQSFAASCLMAVALYHAGAQLALGGRTGAWAGRFSFPLYLMHLLVMLSFSAWASILFMPNKSNPVGLGALFVATLAITLVVSMPVAMFDGWWLRRLDHGTHLLFALLKSRRR